MKSNKLYFILFAFLLILAGCESDLDQLYDQPKNPSSPVLTIEGVTNLIIQEEMETDLYGSVLNWTRANYGKGSSASYTLELSNVEDFGENKISTVIGTDLYSKAITLNQLIQWATDTYGTYDEEKEKWNPVTLYFRVIASKIDSSTEENSVISNVASINISWYEEVWEPVELTVGFKPVEGDWGEYAVYAWGAEEVYGAWPGKVLEPNKEGWYSFVVPTNRPVNLILNNNNNGKQFNFLQDPEVDACYEFVIGEGNDNCDWTEVNCPDLSTYPSSMYMIGSEFGGWNWESDGVAEMIPVWGTEGHFWCVRHISAGQGFKWNSKREWGGDFDSLNENLGFTNSDGNAFVAEDGMYMVYIDMPNGKIAVEPAKVFGMGDCFGGWDMGLFPLEIDGNTMKYTATGTGELRMYANSDIAPIGGDWWKMEFVILDGKIAYRGNGDDQTRTIVNAGQTITLDFNTGVGTIE
ncbi:SusF/SusE family outer membrane protein [Bacteroidales bacterium OttesenSCG-928-L03]|nr:SusF/SusE family outer membrane protein [Bacteroidales bacterium OttesenSCG-928-L03]